MGEAHEASREDERQVIMLPDSAVDFISDEDIETAAALLLTDYRNQSSRDETPVPVEAIAEHYLDYSIDITNDGLFMDPEFLGGISFETNTIFVNTSVEQHEGRYNFTIAHEIGHHVLHKELYDALVDDRSKILCREDSHKPLIELQADRFAAALLMPRDLFISSSPKKKPRSLKSAMRIANLIRKEHGLNNVSLSAIINRLKDLDLIASDIPYQTGKQWRSAKFHNPILHYFKPIYRLLKKIVN